MKKDLIASEGLKNVVETEQLWPGLWCAYYCDIVSFLSLEAYESEHKDVVRDGWGCIITAKSREELVSQLKREYPNWCWEI